MGADIKAFIAGLLQEGAFDGGVTVDRSAEVVEGDILVTINGQDYAIIIEAF